MTSPMFDLPEHLRMGLNKYDQGPVEENSPEFDHWGCWCGNADCQEYE